MQAREGTDGRHDTTDDVFASFFEPGFHADPYPSYGRLLDRGPVHWSPLGGWAVVGNDHAVAALKDPRLSSARQSELLETVIEGREEPTPFARFLQGMMVFRDPPDHTRLRSLVNKAFTPRAVAGLRDAVGRTVGELLDDAADRGSLDVIQDLALPLPLLVICDMLGVPTADRATFARWSGDMLVQIDVLAPSEALAEANRSGGAFLEYFDALVRERRRAPRDDILSALVLAEEEGDRLDHDEVLTTALLLLVAGYETTTNLLGNGVLTLLRHRGAWERLCADESNAKAIVEEVLRYESPVQLVVRTAVAEIELGGVAIADGDQVVVMIGAANRDPRRFYEPDRFDADRPDGHHLAFGHGPHFCLGASLARLEAQIALAELSRRFPELALATDELQWRESYTMRGVRALPVRW